MAAAEEIGKVAIAALRKAAENETVQKAAVTPVVMATGWVAKKAGNAGARPLKTYQLRRMAVDHAKQIHGVYSRRTICFKHTTGQLVSKARLGPTQGQ